MTEQNIITPINSDEISVKEQVRDRLKDLQNYVQGRRKARKGMDDAECQQLFHALDLLCDEVYFWF